jgi:FkbM family methyltransferase
VADLRQPDTGSSFSQHVPMPATDPDRSLVPFEFDMTERALATRMENRIRNILWRRAPLHWRLASGIEIEVANEAEWILYGGIFVDGEYDCAIERVLARTQSEQRLCVLDLGANVGFFTLRLVDRLLRERGSHFPWEATLVEGSPRSYRELQRRLERNRAVTPNVTVVHGLAGRRSGSAVMYEHDFHAANSINNPVMAREGRGTNVGYVELATLAAGMPRIQLLKCDIEGAELQFLESYPDLLEKVESIVLELHPQLCDVARCRVLLADAGFDRHTMIRDAADQSVELFERG